MVRQRTLSTAWTRLTWRYQSMPLSLTETPLSMSLSCTIASRRQPHRFSGSRKSRQQLGLMYHCFPVLRRLRAGCEPVPASLAVPEMGNLDVIDIQNAEYCFT